MSPLKESMYMDSFFELVRSDVDLQNINARYKNDNTLVTDIDLRINELFHQHCKKFKLDIPIISEESLDSWGSLGSFPCFVIDPVDGTKELAQGRPDWSVSIAYLNSINIGDKLNRGWVYQPSKDKLYGESAIDLLHQYNREKPRLLVSRTEFKSGAFENIAEKFDVEVVEMGSIALKLGKLCLGECDLVITTKPKSLWDIAGGLALLSKTGGSFYQGAPIQEISVFQSELTYNSPMLFGNKKFLEVGFAIVNHLSSKGKA